MTSQGDRQSRTLLKWQYIGNGTKDTLLQQTTNRPIESWHFRWSWV